jgi:phage RecT family recombinase
MTKPARQSQTTEALAARNVGTTISLLESPESTDQIRRALGSRGDLQRFVRVARTHFLHAADPQAMANVEPRSYVAACIDAATAGLMPNGRDAYIYPRGKRAVFHPSWRGLIMLVRRATSIDLAAECVFERCKFRVLLGSNRRLDHEPYYGLNVDDADRGELVAAYATATMDDGRIVFRVLSRKELDKRKSIGGPVWGQFYEAMCRKSAIRALADWLPLPDELRDLISKDADDEREDEGGRVTQIGMAHAAPTGDTKQGWGPTAEGIRARAPKKNGATVDATASEPEREREPGEDVEDEGGAAEAP